MRVLLLEPSYRNKYPPLGLMKIASYHKSRGDKVRFIKVGQEEGLALSEPADRVYLTTLFSFEWKRTSEAIDFALMAAFGQPERVFVGGIAASLMREEFVKQPQWAGVRFIAGLLDGPPAQSLQLTAGEAGAEDLSSQPIEERVPDYGILADTDYAYPLHDAYFGYASRGCIRKCHFCGVPKLEGGQKEMPPLANLVNGVAEAHGEKKDLILMDNNITASARYKEVIAEIRDLGFAKGAVLERKGRKSRRRVDFNQGVDARILAKSPMYLREMATICISPLRIAFDHIGVRKVYSQSVRMAAENGLSSLSNYMLYNFMDKPEDLYQRMRLNIALNEELGVKIWSFPMRYQPVTMKDRSHIGRHWNRYYLRSFQVMMQATRGVVSGSPGFFSYAFGESEEAFLRLLSYPHGFIFHREYYERGEGQAVREEYESLRSRLSEAQESELLELLSSASGSEADRGRQFSRLAGEKSLDWQVRQCLAFYSLGTAPAAARPALQAEAPLPAAEELVEDAGLYEPEATGQAHLIFRQ